MTNKNCLLGIACPQCGNDARFKVAVRATACVTDAGTEVQGDLDWADDSLTECPECGHCADWSEFRLPFGATQAREREP